MKSSSVFGLPERDFNTMPLSPEEKLALLEMCESELVRNISQEYRFVLEELHELIKRDLGYFED